MTTQTIETDEQFFALLLAQETAYHVGKREGWHFEEPMPPGWEAICTAADLADTQWKAQGTYFSGDHHTASVFTRYKELRDARHAQDHDRQRAIGFFELMERFSGTMNEDQIYATAFQIVQDWLREC